MKGRRLLICCISCLLASTTALVLACIWYVESDDAYLAYFRKDIPENPQYNYYYSYLNNYDNGETLRRARELNIAEWQRYLGGGLADNDAEQLIYAIPIDELRAIQAKAASRQWRGIAGKWAANSMLARIIERRDLAALNYLLYSRECELQAGRRSEEWDMPDYDPAQQAALLKTGRARHAAARSTFLRLRYAFQVVRMDFYLGLTDDCIADYRSMVEPVKSSAQAKYWAASFYAGALGRTPEALYKYSQVFARCPRYSQAAMRSFRWFSRNLDTTGLIPLCQDPGERAFVYAMLGLNEFDLNMEPLRRVHEQWAECPAIEPLLIREISKIEDALTGDARGDFGKVTEYAVALKDTVLRYVGQGRTESPSLWYTAAAYLAQLTGDNANATLLLTIAEQAHPDAKTLEQIRVVNLLTETNVVALNADTEARILPSLRWLVEKLHEDSIASAEYAYFDRLLAHCFATRLPTLYLDAKRPVEAALCTAIALKNSAFAQQNLAGKADFEMLDRYASVEQLAGMVECIDMRESLPAYKSFLYGYCRQSRSDILELMGTKRLRALRFSEAAELFRQQTDASPLFHLTGDPFEPPPAFARPRAGATVTAAGNTPQPFRSKLTFAVEMAELQRRTEGKRVNPDDMFRYACGLFQMSCFGRSWQLLSYRWSVDDKTLFYETAATDERYYYLNPNPAREAFLRAANLSKSAEMKARCLFYASYCRLMCDPQPYLYDSDGKRTPGPYIKDNEYFRLLKTKYRNTEFYEKAVNRCSYLRDFER